MKLLECLQDGKHVGYRFIDGETAIDYYGDEIHDLWVDVVSGEKKEGSLFKSNDIRFDIKETISVCTEIAFGLLQLYCTIPEFTRGISLRSKSVENCSRKLIVKDYDVIDWTVDLQEPDTGVVHTVTLSSLRL